jgi:hemoglobin
MRHFPYVIGVPERDAWLRHMSQAVAESGAEPAEREELNAYFQMAAHQMMNADLPR